MTEDVAPAADRTGGTPEGVVEQPVPPDQPTVEVTGSGPVPGTSTDSAASSRRKKRRTKGLVEWVVVIAVALIVALGVRQFLLQPFWIPSGSMEDTLGVGDRVLVNKASYRFHGIRHGDVVVFRQPDSWPLSEKVKHLITRMQFQDSVLRERLEECGYDVVLLDLAPSLDVLHRNGLFASDWVILPTRLEKLSIDGVKQHCFF